MTKSTYKGLVFSDQDIVNPEDYVPQGEYNPHTIRPWLISDGQKVIAIVFADCESDALDLACDEHKLEDYFVSDEVMYKFGETEQEQENRLTRLGNAGEPHDIAELKIVALPNPPFSFCALFNAAEQETKP